MIEKKIYEQAEIEVITFECKDILTTSSIYYKDSEAGMGGRIKTFEIEL